MSHGLAEKNPLARRSGKSRDAAATWDTQAVLILDEEGSIRECLGAVQQLSGYTAGDLLAQPVSLLFPRLRDIDLLNGNEVNPKLGYLFHIGFPFKLHHREKADCMCRISLVDLRNSGEPRRLLMKVSIAGSPAGFH